MAARAPLTPAGIQEPADTLAAALQAGAAGIDRRRAAEVPEQVRAHQQAVLPPYSRRRIPLSLRYLSILRFAIFFLYSWFSLSVLSFILSGQQHDRIMV